MSAPKEERYLTVSQVAKRLGWSPDTVRRAADAGKLRGTTRTPGGHWRIPSSTVETLSKVQGTNP